MSAEWCTRRCLLVQVLRQIDAIKVKILIQAHQLDDACVLSEYIWTRSIAFSDKHICGVKKMYNSDTRTCSESPLCTPEHLDTGHHVHVINVYVHRLVLMYSWVLISRYHVLWCENRMNLVHSCTFKLSVEEENIFVDRRHTGRSTCTQLSNLKSLYKPLISYIMDAWQQDQSIAGMMPLTHHNKKTSMRIVDHSHQIQANKNPPPLSFSSSSFMRIFLHSKWISQE